MSARLLLGRIAPIARQAALQVTQRRLHHVGNGAGGLLRSSPIGQACRRRPWPFGSSSIHNVPAVRTISFVRIIPSLFMKLLRVPAMLGLAGIGGIAYIQYQAGRKSHDLK